MRSPRIKLSSRPAVYHCLSRLTCKHAILDDLEREQFRKLMWRFSDFCGVKIITYAVMPDHFHILLRTPAENEPSDQELARRVRLIYGNKGALARGVELDLKLKGKISKALRGRLLKRMGDVSMYMKELKQRFTRWYNRRHNHYGTLWAERFKSVLIEDEPSVVRKLAAYIDLNPVRAGQVKDPKDYRFCGYAEALGAGGKAREGLAGCLPGKDWARQMEYYRQYLFCWSGSPGHSKKRELSAEEIRAKLKQGPLGLSEILRLRVRYMSDGAILGSRAYVEEMFVKFRKHFGKKRKHGARPMQGADWEGMMTLRALRKDIFG